MAYYYIYQWIGNRYGPQGRAIALYLIKFIEFVIELKGNDFYLMKKLLQRRTLDKPIR